MRFAIWAPYFLLLLLAVFVGPAAGGWIERYFRPVLVDHRIDRVAIMDPEHVLCWTWTWTKTRPAAPRAVRYYLQIGQADPVPVFVFRAGKLIGAAERAPGRHTADFCTPLPSTVPPTRARLTGHIIYDMPHGLWDVRQELPTVDVGEDDAS
jgi:hypothetical protein